MAPHLRSKATDPDTGTPASTIPTTPVKTPQPPLPLLFSPPPTTYNTRIPADVVPRFKARNTALSSLYSDFITYYKSIQLLQSHGRALSETESLKFHDTIKKAELLSNSYWALLRDLIDRIRSIYLDGKDPQSTLVLGYSSVKVVIECPYCEDLHEHRRVSDPGIGVPVIYPAGCGAFGSYRIVFPGDIDKSTRGLGKEAIGIQIHKTGTYWMAVKDDMPDLEPFFLVKYRPRKTLPAVIKPVVLEQEVKLEVKVEIKEKEGGEVEEKLMFDAFQRLDIAEHRSYDPVAVAPTRYIGTIKLLQSIARTCAANFNNLEQIVGYYSEPEYSVKVERWKESSVQRETRSKVERETDMQMCTVTGGKGTRVLGLVESDGYRTVCSCLRGPNYPDISIVSGLVESERLEMEADLPLSNKQLRLLVQALAKEIGHEFPKEIPKSAVYNWKRELERKNNSASSAPMWYACHAEKKMLVRFLTMHTTWVPEGFSHNLFRYRTLLGDYAGIQHIASLMKNTRFWVSYDICEDCDKFIEKVGKKFGLHLSFERMNDDTKPTAVKTENEDPSSEQEPPVKVEDEGSSGASKD
ncbi:hypothetical protein TWF694_009028 [Orbilia ellipsospora]|uniref:Uncharacterized protein n=1 Tax=Orbilia ellipsospora TaxID=2528407 RepID=A0AAV9XE29_9PEZI